MKNNDESVKINQNPNWPYILDYPCRILIIGGSGSGKKCVLLNLIKHQRPDADKIYFTLNIHLNQGINCFQKDEKK